MARIPEGVIEEIQSRADIAELIGRYVPLRRAGRHFKAHCPFHKERTPSFMVNTDKQIFHCFGCGVGGNVFSFLMQHDRLTFPEAVRQLGDHVGIRIPEQEASEAADARAALLALTEKICAYFERRLADPRTGRLGRDYLKRRGVSDGGRARFRLGLAPEGWRGLLQAARTTGVAPEQLETAGLVIRGKAGYYDRFRNRLVFPIVDVRGRVIGFGGRSLGPEEPKYLNSPETPIYTKGRHLFGLAQARDAILAEKTAVVVEGYFDCIVLWDAGLRHVVSPLGTALTLEQARLLKRYAETVILAFDADAAGEQATLRGIDLLVEAGLAVRVAELPRGVDPDECLRASGLERFRELLGRSAGIFDVLVQLALRRHPANGIESKVRAAQVVLPTIAKVPDAMLRSEYVRLLAERLKLDEGAVVEELAKTQARGQGASGRAPARGPAARQAAAGPGSERLLAGLLLDEPVRWGEVRARFALDDVVDPALRRVLGVACELQEAGRPATAAHVISELSSEPEGALVTELIHLAQSVSARDEALEDVLGRVRGDARKRELAGLREQIRAAQEAGRDGDVERLLAEYQRCLSHAQGG